MATILLTGFEPFDQEPINPSWELVRRFEGQQLAGRPIQVAQLACEFGKALQQLRVLLERHRPELVICFGQAGGRAEICLERVAINLDDARIPDNAGVQPIDQPVIAGGPAAYFSTLPLKAILKELREQGIPAQLSESAGTYVCNHLFYGLLHEASQMQEIKRAGFVHIPYLPSQASKQIGAPSMALETLEEGLSLIIEISLSGGSRC